MITLETEIPTSQEGDPYSDRQGETYFAQDGHVLIKSGPPGPPVKMSFLVQLTDPYAELAQLRIEYSDAHNALQGVLDRFDSVRARLISLTAAIAMVEGADLGVFSANEGVQNAD